MREGEGAMQRADKYGGERCAGRLKRRATEGKPFRFPVSARRLR